MPKLPVVTPRKLLRALEQLGFVVVRQKGSHAFLMHLDGRHTTVPLHARDLPPGTLGGILHDIDLSVETLRKDL